MENGSVRNCVVKHEKSANGQAKTFPATDGQDPQQEPPADQQGILRSCLHLYRKPLAVNVLCLGFLLFYSLLGGFIFLHFEEPNWRMSREMEMADRMRCVERALNNRRRRTEGQGEDAEAALAERIVERCVLSQTPDERMEWNLKNAVLFGFGILTTLGYGKIEPQTTHGRDPFWLFTVLYGFIGVPFTVIIFTNFGRYLQKLERCVRRRVCRAWHRWRQMGRNGGRKMMRRDGSSRKGSWVLPPITILDEEGGQGGEGPEGQGQNGGGEGSEAGEMLVEEAEGPEEGEEDQISPLTLVLIVFLYLLLGAALIDWLDPHVDFPNGIYFAFLCLTAIEYGKLIPTDALYLPLVIAYICFGLAISTIALDIGSTYVKKLYYLGRKIRNIASIKIWFGAKHLRVRELLAALGHNIGLEPTVLCDLDLEQLISSAIQVKEGRLHRVPQTHMIMDGIWPPELVPLFLKDGGRFPDWVDAEERRKWSVVSLFRRRPSHQVPPKHSGSTRSAGAVSVLLNQPPERTPPLPPLQPDRLSVRFEEFVRTDEDDRWLPLAQRRLLPPPPPTLPEETEPDSTTSGIISDPDLSAIDAALPSSWSLSADPDLHHHHHPQESIAAQLQMRRSETVPPSGHPDSSLFQMCNFPSMEMSTRRPPLPPLRPLPEEEEEREEGSG